MTTQTLNRCENHNCGCITTEDHAVIRVVGNANATKTNKALVVVRPGFSGEGVDQIINLACSDMGKTKVYLKYVVDMDPVAGLYLGEEYFNKLREKAQAALNPQIKKLQAAGLEVEVLPPHFGIAAEEILRTERQIRPDMIIIEAPWLSAFRRLFNRDFSERIVRQAKAPVLTVRPTDDIKERYIAPLVMDAYPHPVAA